MSDENSSQKTAKTIRMDNVIWKTVAGLTPFYGSSESEVVRNIVLMWLHDNLGSETIKELERMKAIKLIDSQ